MSPFVSILLAGSLGGGFGSFAFTHEHDVGLFEVGPSRFAVHGSAPIRLGPERTGYVVGRQSRYEKLLSMRPEPGAPMRILYEPAAHGFSLEYRGGLTMTGSGNPPFLTWSEGSVGPGVPAAPAHWVLVSWPEERAPILLVFPDAPVSLITRADGTGFRIESAASFSGWVRVRAPLGTDKVIAQTASQLGTLVGQIEPHVGSLTAPTPRLTSVAVQEDATGLTVRWSFDSPGAILPYPLAAGGSAGPVQLESGLRKTPYGAVSPSSEIVVRFSASRLAPGVAVVRAKPLSEGSPSPIEAASADALVAAVMEWLGGSAHFRLGNVLEAGNRGYLVGRAASIEAVSKIAVGHGRDGAGAALLAAHCLAAEARGEPSVLVQGLFAGLDWLTWLPQGKDLPERVTAASYLAVAATFRPAPEDRALGAIAQAALASRRDLPLHTLRSWLYPHPGRRSVPPPAWLAALRSPVRLLTPGVETQATESEIILQGQARSLDPVTITLLTDSPLEVAGKFNVGTVTASNWPGRTLVTLYPRERANWLVKLSRPTGAPLPAAVPGQHYSEALR